MSQLLTRIISALIGLFLICGLYLWSEKTGLEFLILIGVSIGAYELSQILFFSYKSKFDRFAFYLFSLSIYLVSCKYPSYAAIIFSFFSVCFCLLTLLDQSRFHNLNNLSAFQAKSILGFFYIGLLPSFAFQMLQITHGEYWFFSLLIVVFSGDIGAYLFGRFFGKRKLMPMVSPKKTIEGAYGGLLFSFIASLLVHEIWLKHTNLVFFLVLSLAAAVVAQFGDLFESLLKRVADVKDSGAIMPGHGGILDRIDGVLFASPVFLLGQLYMENIINNL